MIEWTVTSTETRGSDVCKEYSFMLECLIVSSDSVIVGISLSVESGEIVAAINLLILSKETEDSGV